MIDAAPTNNETKVVSLERLGQIARDLRLDGRKVALCHGVFDLLHVGHIRHLKAAKDEGDVLVVTLTADRFVNKGPGRPVFNENIRAEMLSVLEYVDFVAINHAPTAENVIETVQPDVFVKGSDYENASDDITGKILEERAAVERHGGTIVFTKDITFSSSTLLNRYFDVFDPPLREYLDALRGAGGLTRIMDLIDKVRDMRVLVVGDAIIDEYQYVRPLGKSPKENMIATQFESREVFAGGVIAAANHVADFCAEVEIITVIGDSDEDEELIRASVKPNVKVSLVRQAHRPTTRKIRFVENGYMRKLFEVYQMDDAPTDALDELVATRADRYDVVIAADFGHGAIVPSTIEQLDEHARFLAVNTQSNSANTGYNLITKYPRADYICIDTPEARLAMSDRFTPLDRLVKEQLSRRVPCDKISVTQGSKGCLVYARGQGTRHIPVLTKQVVDTVGAGDAFLAVTSPLVAAGGDMELVGFIGNAVGAIKVGIVGHRTSVEKIPLLKYLTTLLK